MLKKTIALSLTTVQILMASSSQAPELVFTQNTLSKIEKKNKNVRFENIHTIEHISIPQTDNLEGIIVGFDSIEKDKYGMSLQEQHTDAFFITDDGIIVTQAYTKEGKNLMNLLVPKFEKSRYYQKKYLMYGEMDAHNKVMIFSDPFCPLCRQVYEKLHGIKTPKDVAIFFYEFPLAKIHPASELLIPIVEQSKRKGKDITQKVYTNSIFENLSQITDMKLMIKKVEKFTGFKTSEEELKEYDNISLIEQHTLGNRLGVSSTPSAYINGYKASIQSLFKLLQK